MINVTFILHQTGELAGYQIKGHADTSDTICAAVSALSQAVYIALEELHSATLKTVEKGCFEVTGIRRNKQAKAIASVLTLGLRDLAKTYPKDIIIREF